LFELTTSDKRQKSLNAANNSRLHFRVKW